MFTRAPVTDLYTADVEYVEWCVRACVVFVSEYSRYPDTSTSGRCPHALLEGAFTSRRHVGEREIPFADASRITKAKPIMTGDCRVGLKRDRQFR